MKVKQTGLNIKKVIDLVLGEFGCTNDNNYFVTDNARNMISACDDKDRYSCSGHNINLALKHTFLENNNSTKEIKLNLDRVKNIITLMKRKGLMRDFELKLKSIPQDVETRFNSKYHMINAFIDVYENLKDFAKVDKDLLLEVLSIDEAILKDIIPIFKMFDTSTLILSQNNSLTIHLVIQIKRIIISNLKSSTSDSEIISDFKKIFTTNVEKFMKIHFIHNFALIFDPKRRDLKLLSGEEREEVKKYLAECMKSLSLRSQNQNESQKS